ncbi:hypothetical protein V8F33_003903 [Rhypophila sp. PSN 637]
MSGNSDPDIGSDFRSKPWATPESSMEALPSRGGRSLTPKIVPKGKFSNFDEAHLAITSRLAAPRSRSASNNSNSIATPSLGSVDSIPSSLDVLTSSSRPSDLVATVQQMEFAHGENDRHIKGRSLTAPYNNPFSANRHGDQNPALSLAPPNASLPALPVGHLREKEDSENSIEEDYGKSSATRPRGPRETGSTVDNIYKQYLPSESPSFLGAANNINDDELNPRPDSQPASSNGDDTSDTSDTNYKLEGSKNLHLPKIWRAVDGSALGKNRHQMTLPPSPAPQIPLPELPSAKIDLYQGSGQHTPAEDEPNISDPSGTTISDSQNLLNGALVAGDDDESHYSDQADAHEPNLFSSHEESDHQYAGLEYQSTGSRPRPDSTQHLRPAEHHNHEHHSRGSFVSEYGGLSNGGFSTGAITNESDDDPFRYDRGSYNVFIKPLREREVSVALHQVHSVPSTPHRKGKVRASSPESPSRTPRSSVPPVPAIAPQFTKTSNNPFLNQMNLKQYQNPALSQALVVEDNLNQVKVLVQPAQKTSNHSPRSAAPGLASRLEGLKEPKIGLTINDAVSDGEAGDWETVGTNIGHYDNNRTYASDKHSSNSRHIIKTTGSSIADYSDDGFPPPSFGHQSFGHQSFASGDRILQHPMPGDVPATQHIRTLKDTGRPVFIPKPRFHQVNGYLQNSVRSFTGQNSASTGSSATKFFSEKLTAPFRSDSFNRKRQEWSNPYNNIDRSRFEFRDSFGSANSFNLHRNKSKRGPVWKDETENDEERLGNESQLEDSPYTRTDQGTQKAPVPDGSSLASQKKTFQPDDGSIGVASTCQFAFPLIPLQEAAKREALRRESGEDVSFVSSNRTRKNSSWLSSNVTPKTTPRDSVVMKPPPTHQCRPVTAFGFHEDTQSTIRAVGDQPSSPLRGHGDMIPTVSTGTLPSNGHPVFSRSFRNPLSSLHGSPESKSTVRRPSPHLWPRNIRRRTHQPSSSGDMDLRGIADLERGPGFGFISEDASLSWETRRRREYYYYAVCALCILPFFAVFIVRNKSHTVLSWYTKGETCTLNTRQRQIASRVAKISGVVWICAFAVLITVLISKH